MLDYFLAILRPKTYVMADLAKGATETVPAWDGNPRGWRRYSREVLWYVMGTKKSSRPFLAPRLIAKLTGPARLLAMSWSQVDFRGKSGVKTLLTRLAESPLVRKNLPNTSAVMNQYFNYKRFPNETDHCQLPRSGVALLRGVQRVPLGLEGGTRRRFVAEHL